MTILMSGLWLRCLILAATATRTLSVPISATEQSIAHRKQETISVNADGSLTDFSGSESLRAEREALAQAAAGAQQAAKAAQRAAAAAAAAADSAEAAQNRAMRKEGSEPPPPELRPVEQGLHPLGLVIMADQNFQGKYTSQIQSIRCYAQQQGYDLWLLNGSFPRCVAFRSDFFYLKHCAVAELLETRPERYTAVVLDADVVAVVLDRGLERWLRSPGELQFYQRIAGPEVMAGNYLARNVPCVREFLRRWALLRSRKPPGFSSADNGALHVALVNILELEGAENVSALYSNLTALVDNLDPYWDFVRAAEKVLGPPRAWNLANTAFGQKTCTWSDSCVLTIWPRMNFFVDDGVYLGQKANGLIGPVMHHGIKNAHDVEHHYYQNVWSCTIDAGASLVDQSSFGHQAWQIAAGYPELYPQGLGCAGPQCAEACVSNFTCFPLDDDDEPLMRKRQRDTRYLFVLVRRVLCFAFALVVVLGAVRVAIPIDFSTWLGDWVGHDRPFACARLSQDPHRENLHRYVRRGEQCLGPSKHEGWFWIDR